MNNPEVIEVINLTNFFSEVGHDLKRLVAMNAYQKCHTKKKKNWWRQF